MNKPLTPEQLETIERYSRPGHSENTCKAYDSDERNFKEWMSRELGRHHVPAGPDDVILYLVYLKTEGKSYSTITRRVACISTLHQQALLSNPTKNKRVKNTIGNIEREIGSKKSPADAITVDVLQKLIEVCPKTKAGLGYKTMMVLGFSAALRRSEIVGVDWEHIAETDKFLILRIPKSKTDQGRAGHEVRIPKCG